MLKTIYIHIILLMLCFMLWILVRYVYKSQHIETLKMEGDEMIHVFDVVKSCCLYLSVGIGKLWNRLSL